MQSLQCIEGDSVTVFDDGKAARFHGGLLERGSKVFNWRLMTFVG